jgi:hypothetical protein
METELIMMITNKANFLANVIHHTNSCSYVKHVKVI